MSRLNEIAKLPKLLIQAWERKELDFLGPALDLQEHHRSQLSPTLCAYAARIRLVSIARKCGAGKHGLTGAGLGCF